MLKLVLIFSGDSNCCQLAGKQTKQPCKVSVHSHLTINYLAEIRYILQVSIMGDSYGFRLLIYKTGNLNKDRSKNSLRCLQAPQALNMQCMQQLVYVENRPFAGSGHMVQNKLCWDANDTVGLSKQRKVGLGQYEFLCFENPTALFVSKHNVISTR